MAKTEADFATEIGGNAAVAAAASGPVEQLRIEVIRRSSGQCRVARCM
jgi:hypothetical protein